MIIDPEELQRRCARRIAGARDKKVYIGPEIVTLDIINSCNLRCRFCATDHAPGNPRHFDKPRLLSWDNFLSLVNDCVDLKVDQIDIGGPGEPSMHPQFREMMAYLEKQPLRVRLVSNGTFPLDYCSDVIKGDKVVINLSAASRQVYRDLQGKDFFDRVISNIKRLARLRKTGKPGFFIEIAYVLNAVNVHQKEKIQELAADLEANWIIFRKMNIRSYNRQIALQDENCRISGEKRKSPPRCLNGWFYLTVRLDGKTSYCYRLHQTGPGDIHKQSLKDIWLSKQAMAMRLLGKYGYLQKKFKECRLCPFYEENIQRSKRLREGRS